MIIRFFDHFEISLTKPLKTFTLNKHPKPRMHLYGCLQRDRTWINFRDLSSLSNTVSKLNS